jgi:hypothetical protein
VNWELLFVGLAVAIVLAGGFWWDTDRINREKRKGK